MGNSVELGEGEIPFKELLFLKLRGRGSFGEVWEGSHKGKKFAIKKMNYLPRSENEEFLDEGYNEQLKNTFLKEILILMKLENENIVKYLGYSKKMVGNDTTFCIIMEFMELGSLSIFLKKSKERLSVDEKLILIRGLIESLVYLKEKRVVHRDVKPDNILIFKKNGSYHCKLADFGGARNLSTIHNTKAVFSAFYAAPELLDDSQINSPPFSFQSDIYAFGVVLLIIISGGSYVPKEYPIKSFPMIVDEELNGILEIAKNLCNADPSKRLTIEEVRKRFYCTFEEFTKKIFYEYWRVDINNFSHYCFYLLNVISMKRNSKELNFSDENKERIMKLMKKCKGDLDIKSWFWFSYLTTNSKFDEVVEILEKLSKESLTQLCRSLKSNFDSKKVKVIHLKNNSIAEIRECLTGFMFKFIDFVDKDYVFYSPIKKEIFSQILDDRNLNFFVKLYKNIKKARTLFKNFEAKYFLSCAKLGSIHLLTEGCFSSIAIENFEKSIKLNPNFEYSYNGLGFIYKYRKDYPKAIEFYEKAIELGPNNEDPYFKLGSVYSDLKNYPKAIEFYLKSIKINPNFEYPYNGLGTVCYNLKNYPKSIEFFEKSIKVNPNYEYPYNNLGIVYSAKSDLEDYPKAIEFYEKAIKVNPNYESPYNGLGVVYDYLKDYPKAIEFYEKSIKVNPNYEAPYNNLGYVYLYLLKDYPKAIEFYEKAIKLNPNNEDTYFKLGNVYKNLKNYPKAIEFYEKSIKLNPNDEYPYNGLGIVYRILKNYPKAIEFYEKSIKVNPNDEYPYNGLGNVYSDLKNYPKAIEFYEKSIKLNPNNEYPYNGLGNVYKNLKNYPKAIEFYEKSIKVNPNFEYPYKGLGFLYYILKNYPKAIGCCEKAIKINPKYSSPYYGLYLVYELTNQPKKSEENYKKYQELEKK